MGLAYSLRGLVHGHPTEEDGRAQADEVLEKELRGLDPDPWAAGREGETVPGMDV